MKRCMTVLLTAAVLALGIFLVTLPVQIAEAHLPVVPTATTAQLVRLPSNQATPRESSAPEPTRPDSPTDDVAWLAGIVIALPVLAVLLAALISTRRRRAPRPVKRPGQSY